MKLRYPALVAALSMSSLQANDLVITGVMDATLTGGTPKVVELFVVNDIPDLSVCGLGSANNGGGTDGQEFTFEAAAATAGSYLYVASESENFAIFMGFAPTHIGGSAVGINGDDGVELFCNDIVVDTFGDINVDGNGEPWEYLDGWAYRNSDTGPDGAAFVIANWTFSGANALDGEATNDTAAAKFPIKTFAPETSVFSGVEVVVEEDDPVLIGACTEVSTLISAIQGPGSASPLVGETHVIEGVVTAATPNLSGFFVQEETADMDGDALTSEGIFVSYSDTLPLEGEVVRVLGDVSEFFDKTQLSASDILQGCGTETPSVADLVMPFASLDDIEALEGMLVSSAQELLVTSNFGLARFGQATLSSKRLYTPTNLHAPGSDEAIALEASNTLDRIILDDGDNSQNPDSIPYPTGGLSAANSLRLGNTVSTLTAVVDYSFGEYLVIPVADPTFAGTNARTDAPDLDLGNLRVASLNVLNYFETIDDGSSICGPAADSGCRGADDAEEFGRQKAKIISAIVAMDADIVGLMEIENNGFDDTSAIADLVTGINAEMGDGTYAILNPGAPIGTDAITVALIYKPAVVTLEGDAAILTSANSASGDNGEPLFDDTKNRPSLVQQFALVENGETIVISVNHLKSKGSSCGDGDDDTTTGQGSCNLTRSRAAQALTTFIASEFPDAAALIIGDLNSYAKEDPIALLEEAGYTNIVSTFGGAEAYTYTFDGLLGNLDHALANESALAKTIDVTEWHINADEPIALDYNTRFKTDDQIISFYAADAYRSSDHDPVLVSLQLDAPNVAPTITSANTANAINENSGAGQVVYTITSTDNDGTATVYSLKAGDDDALFTIDDTSGDVTLTADPDFETKSDYLFTVVATDSAGSSSEQAVTLNINDIEEPIVEEPVDNDSSGGSLSIILLGLLTMIGIRRKK